MIKPNKKIVSREGNIIFLTCPSNTHAVNCESKLNSMFNNPLMNRSKIKTPELSINDNVVKIVCDSNQYAKKCERGIKGIFDNRLFRRMLK